MVFSAMTHGNGPANLSVLALSSRFDGRAGPFQPYPCLKLSVLALSSRFDGLGWE